jgi:hypothetical protein
MVDLIQFSRGLRHACVAAGRGGGGGLGPVQYTVGWAWGGCVGKMVECCFLSSRGKKLPADPIPTRDNWTTGLDLPRYNIHLQYDDGDIYPSVYPAIQSNSSSTGTFPIPGILGTRTVGFGIERYVCFKVLGKPKILPIRNFSPVFPTQPLNHNSHPVALQLD